MVTLLADNVILYFSSNSATIISYFSNLIIAKPTLTATPLPATFTATPLLATLTTTPLPATQTVTPLPTSMINTDSIAGHWTGIVVGIIDRTFSTHLDLFIQNGCSIGNLCGTYSTPQLSCSGSLLFVEMRNHTYVFLEKQIIKIHSCLSGGSEYINLLSDGTLSWRFQYTSSTGEITESIGILKRP